MSGPQVSFEVQETRGDEAVLLRLMGELDMASAPALQHRLEALRADGTPVRLDLSNLDFIDSSGIDVLVRALNSASADEWAFQVDPHVSPAITRILEIANLDQLIVPNAPGKPEPPTRPGSTS